MVVARKTPVAPVASSSRSSSTQQVQKPVKPKTAPSSTTTANGKVSAPSKKSKSTETKKLKRSKPSYSTRLFLVLVSALTVYTVSFCRTDFPRTSPVCQSLDLYRQHVLDPYVVPPIQTLVHHVEPYIEPIKPYATTATDFTRTHVVPRASALLDFTLKQYHTHVAPRLYWFFVDQYFNGFLKPIYYKGIHPYIEPQLRPYRAYYKRFIVPGSKRLAADANVLYIRYKPHAAYYLSEAQRHTIAAYEIVRPHVIAAYQRTRPHAIVILENVKIHALDLSRKLGDVRRQFVDPHVLRIWEKVVEADVTSSSITSTLSSEAPSSETHTPAPTQPLEDEPTPSSPSPIIAEPVVQTPEPVVTLSPVTEPEPVPEAEPEVLPPSSQEETVTPSPSSSSSSSPESTSSSGAEIPPPSAPVHASPIPAAEHEAASAASVVAASLHVAESVVEPEPEETASAEEVDEFLKDIGVSEEGETVPQPVVVEKVEEVQTEVTPPTYGDVEPSPEEKLAITAKKRADITARHERWQADLDALVRTQMQDIRASLSISRAAAIAELAEWGPNKKGVVHEVESEANKLLKGLDGYLRGVEEKIKKANGKQTKEQMDKDKEMWAKVVEKVEQRLTEKVRDVQKEVHEWFMNILDLEQQEVDAASTKVKALADRAQADLGLDYAWLDDVTYNDWQKYHDLMRTSENFTSQTQKIQAQVDPLGSNELVDALNNLEADVNELVEGFEVIVDGDKRRAETEVFVNAPEPESPTQEKAEEPEVSILPIEPAKEKVIPEEIFVGRSQEEVEAKLADVPVQNVHSERDEL